MCAGLGPASRRHGPPPENCPFWKNVPFDFSLSMRPGQTNGFVSDQRLPYLPLKDTYAHCLGISGTRPSLCPLTHRTFSLPEMHSPLLSRPERPEDEKDTQKYSPAHSQFLPMANLNVLPNSDQQRVTSLFFCFSFYHFESQLDSSHSLTWDTWIRSSFPVFYG